MVPHLTRVATITLSAVQSLVIPLVLPSAKFNNQKLLHVHVYVVPPLLAVCYPYIPDVHVRILHVCVCVRACMLRVCVAPTQLSTSPLTVKTENCSSRNTQFHTFFNQVAHMHMYMYLLWW